MINKLLELQGRQPDKPAVVFAPPNVQLYTQLADLQEKRDQKWKQVEQTSTLSGADIKEIENLEDQMAAITMKIAELAGRDTL